MRASADRFVLHLDVDVVDFLDLPVGEIRCTTQARPRRGDGLPGRFRPRRGLDGFAITQFNPDHGAEDGSTNDALVRGLVGAFAG